MTASSFPELVRTLVADIPPGRVMTYGDVASACGHPGAARQVGFIAHAGADGIPWHRVVRANGYLAAIEDTAPTWQADALRAEGVELNDGRIMDFEHRRWYPEQTPAG